MEGPITCVLDRGVSPSHQIGVERERDFNQLRGGPASRGKLGSLDLEGAAKLAELARSDDTSLEEKGDAG